MGRLPSVRDSLDQAIAFAQSVGGGCSLPYWIENADLMWLLTALGNGAIIMVTQVPNSTDPADYDVALAEGVNPDPATVVQRGQIRDVIWTAVEQFTGKSATEIIAEQIAARFIAEPAPEGSPENSLETP